MPDSRAGSTLKSGLLITLAAALAVLSSGESHGVSAAGRALLVGVEEYPAPTMRLRGVREDLRLLRSVLIEKGVFSADQIKVLADEQASKKSVIKSFKEWLIERTRPGETALFYFNGHGIQVWDSSGDEVLDGMDEALMCWDSVVMGTKSRGRFKGRRGLAYAPSDTARILLDDELHDLLAQMKGRRVLFISDSCHSGSVYKRLDRSFVQNKTLEQPVTYKSVFEARSSTTPAPAVGKEKNNLGDDLIVEGIRIAALTASDDAQPAQVVVFNEEPSGYHSVFSWYLYHGLRGKADLNCDGAVSLKELSDFVAAEVKRNGYAQVPQSQFEPKQLADLPLIKGVTRERAVLRQPTDIACSIVTRAGISKAELEHVKSLLAWYVPKIRWLSDPEKISCRLELEKKNDRWGGRISDSTGAYWESHESESLEDVIGGLGGNLRAHYIRSSLNPLVNRASAMDLHVMTEVRGLKKRVPGETVKGDRLIFKVTTKSGGVPYIFSVDALGVIHPLYPDPGKAPGKIAAGESIILGEKHNFLVGPPFGQEILFALLLKGPSRSLDSLWEEDDIGAPDAPGSTAQVRFLDRIRDELTQAGEPVGKWASRLILLRSFSH